mgnify:CR=1 FL=1
MAQLPRPTDNTPITWETIVSVIHESLVQWELEKSKMEHASRNANAALVAALTSVIGTGITVLYFVTHINGG